MTEYICTSCDYVGKRKKVMRGSRGVEIFLWVVLLIPGPFYTLWRMFTKRYACPHCGEHVMVPVRSKLGKEKIQDIEDELSPENIAKIPDRWAKDREEYAATHNSNKTVESPLPPVVDKHKNDQVEETKDIKKNDEDPTW